LFKFFFLDQFGHATYFRKCHLAIICYEMNEIDFKVQEAEKANGTRSTS
jgi:hypothetical protein